MVDITHISAASTTAANNLALQGISTAEGWLPSTVNNWGRALEAILAGFYSDFGGLGTIGGTANAITLTNVVPIDALRNGQIMALKNTSGPNSAATTLNVDGKGAKAIRLQGDTALAGGELLDDAVYLFRYDTAYNAAAGAWIVLNPNPIPASAAARVLTATGKAGVAGSSALQLGATSNSPGDDTLTLSHVHSDASAVSQVSDFLVVTTTDAGVSHVTLPDDTGTFTATLTGCTTSPTIDYTYQRVGRAVICSPVNNSTMSATSNATTKTLTGMPTALFPATAMEITPFNTADNGGALKFGLTRLTTGGVITLGNGPTTTVFTNSGTFNLVPSSFAFIAAA